MITVGNRSTICTLYDPTSKNTNYPFNAGLSAVIRPWRPQRERIQQTVLVDTGVSGDQFSSSSAAVEKGLALECRSNNGLLEQLFYGAWLTWACHECHQFLQIFFNSGHLTFEYSEDVCHLSSRLDLDDQHFGLWLNLWHDVRGQITLHMKVWCAGVLFIHTWECVNYSICQR